jgi:hypothetical protein
MLLLEQFCMAMNLDNSEIRSEIPGKFLNVILEKGGENQLGRSCEKLLHRVKGERNILQKIKRGKAELYWSHVVSGVPSETRY